MLRHPLAGARAVRRYRGLLVRDVRVYQDNHENTYSSEVFIHNRRTDHRSRTVPLTDSLCRELLPLCRLKGPDAPVFGISYTQLDYLWKRVRREAGLDYLRFKDLRAQAAIYGEETGVPLTVITKTLGHNNEAMTRRSLHDSLSSAQAEAIERAMLPAGDEGGRNAKRRSVRTSAPPLAPTSK